MVRRPLQNAQSDVGEAMLGIPPTPSPGEMRRFQRSLSNQLVGAGHPGVLSKFAHDPQKFEEARGDVQVRPHLVETIAWSHVHYQPPGMGITSLRHTSFVLSKSVHMIGRHAAAECSACCTAAALHRIPSCPTGCGYDQGMHSPYDGECMPRQASRAMQSLQRPLKLDVGNAG